MSRRVPFTAVLGVLLVITAACTNKKSVNPLANVGSKQPDKVLFDKAMDAMKHNRFDVARMTLQTLINTYPDSEFVARAKLAVGDSWYPEGGAASLAQAEQEYRDFETFFPNMPEAAEAQLKIANIQYQQMEKSDRDFTHAKRAEDEYRTLIMQYPDNAKLVAEGKERLLEVQEVLAEREFEIGRFYYLRQSYPASIARLQSLVEKYPLYSKADEALFLLGQNYEAEIAHIRAAPTCTAPGKPPGCANEAMKTRLIEQPTKSAAEAYSKIITRYPIMDRVDDAKKRLAAMHQPVPRPTKAAVAQNKAEDASRRETSTFGKLMGVVRKGPDMAKATKVGDPNLVEPTPVSARDISNATMQAAMGGGGEKNISVEKVDANGVPAANEPAPRSDAPPATAGSSPFTAPAGAAADPNELKPAEAPAPANNAPDPNELKPNSDNSGAALPPPPQVNEIQQGQASSQAPSSSSSTASADPNAQASDEDLSSSKKKKKKGLKKVVPF
ncbi:MAG TPA: outer membrane protein assembly factor BamD [Candidatus Sulfotelmatobacter sp.]